MAASVLNSSRAVEMSIYGFRAFLRLRETFATHKELAAKLAELEQRLETHDHKIVEIIKAIHVLAMPPEKPARQIGFRPDAVSKPKMLKANTVRPPRCGGEYSPCSSRSHRRAGQRQEHRCGLSARAGRRGDRSRYAGPGADGAGQPVYAEIVRAFGPEVVQPDGCLNRARLAELAFQGGRLNELNAIVHPAVIEAQRLWMDAVFERDPAAVAVIESALIFEVERDARDRGEKRDRFV